MESDECFIEIERLKLLIYQFQCPICLNLAKDPRECVNCGGLIGLTCLKRWQKNKK